MAVLNTQRARRFLLFITFAKQRPRVNLPDRNEVCTAKKSPSRYVSPLGHTVHCGKDPQRGTRTLVPGVGTP